MASDIEVIDFLDESKPPKNNKLMKLLLLVLFLIFFALIGLLIYILINKQEKPEQKKEDEKPPEVVHINMDQDYFEKLLENEIIIDYSEVSFNVNTLSNNEKQALLLCTGIENFAGKNTIKKEEFDTFLNKYYNIKINNSDVSCSKDHVDYKYDETQSSYIKQDSLINEYNIRSIYSKTINYEQKDNKYTLTRIKLYESINTDINGYFSSVLDAKSGENLILGLDSYNEEEIELYKENKMYEIEMEINYSLYENLLKNYVYTFEKIDNNFVLVSYEIR